MSKNIAIVGAGISGLALAWFLQKRFQDSLSITIFEANARVGGWLQTASHNGQMFECGPRSIRSGSQALSELLIDLKLEGEVLKAVPSAQKRYLIHEGKLEPLPYSIASAFTLPLGRKALCAAMWELFSQHQSAEDESVESFFERHIGKYATKTFVSALTSGIYACDPSELSMRSGFPQLWEKAKSHGSILLAPRGDKVHSFTFKEGIETLPKRLCAMLDAKIELNTPVARVEEKQDGAYLTTAKGELCFDQVFCAVPAPIVRKIAPQFLNLSISQTSVATVSLAYDAPNLQPSGYGFLCPTHEDPHLLGVVFDSSLFPEQNQRYKTRLSVMMGGTKAPFMLDFSNEVLLAYATEFVRKFLGIKVPPSAHMVFRAENAISCYPVGHHRTLEFLAEKESRIHVLGSGFHGVSVADCITNAQSLAKLDFAPFG